ncbi:putative ubiquinone biosynthesis monooxygenase [Nowakowskiella sp. JEL0407]|nr:putative ubiquinone biosynthesis monooxygenase [Nowakowskiella sp. JEL0407]
MAGQGLNLGLEDAKSLSEAVLQAVVDGSDIGNIHSLQPYSANRYISNSIMLGGVDLIGRIFSVENGAFAWLRGIGMGAFGRIPGLKEQVVRFATHAGL